MRVKNTEFGAVGGRNKRESLSLCRLFVVWCAEPKEIYMLEAAGKLHYRVKFNLAKMTQDQKNDLWGIESALRRIGITFDAGSDGDVRDWEWDWSLKGPISIEAREPTPQK